jgi:VanZ family protein
MISFIFSIRQGMRITLSLIYIVFIALLSLLPPNDLPEIPLFPGADKIVHTCMYLGLALLICWSMHAEIKRVWYYLIILFSIGWGAMMELFQFLMHAGRSFEFNDIAGNILGSLVGVFIYIMVAQRKKILDLRKFRIR